MKSTLLTPLVSVLGLALGLAADSSMASCSDEARDCGHVCGRYRDCLSSSYDVAACQARCEKKASDDRDFDDRLEHCASCLDGRSCSEATSKCVGACLGIVP